MYLELFVVFASALLCFTFLACFLFALCCVGLLFLISAQIIANGRQQPRGQVNHIENVRSVDVTVTTQQDAIRQSITIRDENLTTKPFVNNQQPIKPNNNKWNSGCLIAFADLRTGQQPHSDGAAIKKHRRVRATSLRVKKIHSRCQEWLQPNGNHQFNSIQFTTRTNLVGIFCKRSRHNLNEYDPKA